MTDLPIVYRRARAYILAVPAKTRDLAALLPDPRLRVVEIWPGTAVLTAVAFDYEDTSIGPYREAALSIPCRWDHPASIPLLPLVAEKHLKDVGHWVQLLPVTTQVANDAGRSIWGYPKYVGRIDIEHGATRMRCQVFDGDQPVFGFEIDRPGPSRPMQFPVRTYSRLSDEIHFTEIDVDAVGSRRFRGARGALTLADHPRLAGLPPPARLGKRALETRWFDEYRLRLDRASAKYRMR
ncbi:MAG: acetoacetate decarboxylase family protein [Polyangiaceae bacterium]|nr:acetoacetate decarboxylase family protein [Polyangiaceae bacterium]